jgi:hypothetical protein
MKNERTSAEQKYPERSVQAERNAAICSLAQD